MAEAQGKGVHGAQTRLFGEAFVDQLKRLAFHGAAGVVEVVKQHGRFKHGHGGVQGRGLRAGGAHLNDTLAGGGNVGVFLAKLTVGEDLHFVFAVGKLGKILAKQVHTDGFRLTFGLHARNLDDGLGLRGRGKAKGHAANKTQSDKQCYDAFHSVNLLTCKLLCH